MLLVPVGATEQHGPHLPLTTDTDIAVALCARAASLESRAVVAPALAYGSSGEHEGFAGTLSIGGPATEQVLVELGRSASAHFSHLVLVSTHGGNRAVVDRAVARLQAEGRSAVAWVPSWTGDLHAGRTETSLMLAIAPERVDLTAAVAGDRRPARDPPPPPPPTRGAAGVRQRGARRPGRGLRRGRPATAGEAAATLSALVARLASSTVSTGSRRRGRTRMSDHRRRPAPAAWPW